MQRIAPELDMDPVEVIRRRLIGADQTTKTARGPPMIPATIKKRWNWP